MKIEKYTERYHEEVVALILRIQQKEFNVPISLSDQPDLMDIGNFYADGGFWIARDGDTVVGTIATWFIDGPNATIRKLFTDENYRGKEYQTGQRLLETLEEFCAQNGKSHIFLGTTDKFKAAHRFYEKNGYIEISKADLPADFDILDVDSKFYHKAL
ncbi:GNAT family N-acetyltransferase [Listeria sp. ILCC792]|uniref:GNAT family N-acetyltransferase n=1 Tax=Listeria sp. ILCC792 TaxID=1918331 RepID=UPI000B58B2DB|nr:GNAT family N-acetyltransferase [Listeria sp. ILCC792]